MEQRDKYDGNNWTIGWWCKWIWSCCPKPSISTFLPAKAEIDSVTVRVTWLWLLSNRIFSSLLEVTWKGARGACHFGYRTAPVLICIAAKDLCHRKGGSYICLPRKPRGPNMFERSMEGFILYPACSPWECYGVDRPRAFWATWLTGKDAQPLQSVKNCYNSRAHGHERPRKLIE
jgi:hypothetical protein